MALDIKRLRTDFAKAPVLKGDVKKVRQEVIKGGQLVKGGISGDDVTQKYLADCYLIAAMSAVARASPEVRDLRC